MTLDEFEHKEFIDELELSYIKSIEKVTNRIAKINTIENIYDEGREISSQVAYHTKIAKTKRITKINTILNVINIH